MLTAILRAWTRIEMILIGCLIFAALGIFLGGAVVRAVLPAHSVDWAEEVAIYCIIWATMLSGSVLVADRRHISTEVGIAALPPRTQNAIGWGVTALAIAFCTCMAVFGWQAFRFAILLDERSASTLRTPQAWAVFLALPVGMVLILGKVAMVLLSGARPFGADLPPRSILHDTAPEEQ